MDFTEGLFEAVALNLFGDTKIRLTPDGEGTGYVIDLKAPWKRMSLKEAIKTYGHLDVDKMSEEEMRARLLKETHIDLKRIHQAPRGALIAILFEEFAEPHLIQPHHIIDHPLRQLPFASSTAIQYCERRGL